MKRSLSFALLLVLLAGLVLPTASFAAGPRIASSVAEVTPSSQTYTVMVGLDNPRKGVSVMAYFPDNVTIHVGDTVRWVQNSNEFHTVTFLAGTDPATLPLIIGGADPSTSPIMLNPGVANPVAPADGMYDGTTFANSGLMGYESWEYQNFSLTFTQEGTYDYLCLVHGVMMSGEIRVVGPGVPVASPNQAMALGKMQMAKKLAQVPAAMRAAEMLIQPPVKNPDGTMTHYVMLGYHQGQIDLMRFFPDKLTVSPGDTVVWDFPPGGDAPHTVTFLNGAPAPDLVLVVPQPSGPPLLYANPGTFFPYQPGPDLTRTGVYNSGVMEPIPGTTYSLVIGDMAPGLEPFLCLLHDDSGMVGNLMVVPR
jgi:plastocyanin